MEERINNNNPLISIIVPVYNVELYINDCIESLVNQTYTNIEIVLIDDGSIDNSSSICNDWEKKDKRVKFYSKSNGGVSSARNCGIKNAKGDFIFFIDSDDYLDHELIEVLLNNHDGKIDTIALVDFDRVNIDGAALTAIASDNQIEVYKKSSIREFTKIRRGWYCWGCLISAKLVQNNLLLFDENLHNLEDAAWLGLLMNFVNTIVFVKGTMYHYRENPNSITSHCVDYAWQAKCWLNVYNSIMNNFNFGYITRKEKKHIRKMKRFCMNNFYAESYYANLTYNEINKIRTGGGGKILRCLKFCGYFFFIKFFLGMGFFLN
ncbi:MAG: glycosyltransferase, partial [Erysipelotrichaceae bacterium]|nr:glycosyltransferase [Erysipelotrichaceae bacterium]